MVLRERITRGDFVGQSGTVRDTKNLTGRDARDER